MLFKRFRYWLASKVLGGLVIEETEYQKDIEVAKHQFIKEQLEHGNRVTLGFSATTVTPIAKRIA